MSEKIQIAMLGAGLMARAHLEAIRKLEDRAELAAADAVIVCIPNHLHAPATLAALQSGKHVLVEKPMALSLADAEAMVAAAERARRVLMCGLSLRFMSPIR